jgi:quinol monooxygenase YgiN
MSSRQTAGAVGIRAFALLTAAPGKQSELLAFTLQVLPRIRTVPGLESVEVSRSLSNPDQLLLYYRWESAQHSREYLDGPLYAEIAPRLAALASDHMLVLGAPVET